MASFSKELKTIEELLTDAYNKGLEDGSKRCDCESFAKGEVYRHKRLEDKGVFFEVGDIVCTTASFDWEGIRVFPSGTVGTIVEKHQSEIYNIMLYKVEKEGSVMTYLYGAADIDFVAHKSDEPKVGSIVKIVKEYNDYNLDTHLFSKGTLGVIASIKEDCPEKSTDGRYKYEIKNHENTFYYDRDGFEVVTKMKEGK